MREKNGTLQVATSFFKRVIPCQLLNKGVASAQIIRFFLSHKYLSAPKSTEDPRFWVNSCGELAWNDPIQSFF